MMYALRHDVVPSSQLNPGCYIGNLTAGNVKLRSDKRPRPLVLRVNEGDCLRIEFQNLLNSTPVDDEQPHTRRASFHVQGLELRNTIRDDGSNAGQNGGLGNGTGAPGGSVVYEYVALKEGSFIALSMGATVGGEGDAGSIAAGLFGAVIVEPYEAEWYRSQVTEKLLRSVSTYATPSSYPVIDYDDTYSASEDCLRQGMPKLAMLDPTDNHIVHSDLTALITGPNKGDFGPKYPDPSKVHPERGEPFREFTIIFHDEIAAVQAFPQFYDDELEFTLHSVRDAFAINYGTGGIGAEILANRLEVGPVHECVECLYEEFFLTAWAVGDPSMIVDVPANYPCDQSTLDPDPSTGISPCEPKQGPKANKALYPDDPSNVYHSYLNDHVKFRNLLAGSDDHHVFHLHAHQWTRTPYNPDSIYLDSQAIGQGTSFTYEIAYEGSGNRNKTVGDSIFHCHFYPHFAQGMWAMWRVHDVLEVGTELDDDGVPVVGSRALPDGEIAAGTPIPGVVPTPKEPMAVLPAGVQIVGGQVDIIEPIDKLAEKLKSGAKDFVNPGYPFFIPGIAGHRPPHPPMDTVVDGGLARHVVNAPGLATSSETRLDFSKHVDSISVEPRAENGEPVEKLAMAFHNHPIGYSNPTPLGGSNGRFAVNKGTAKPGAPYADPCIDDLGNPITKMRSYKAADIELDVTFNKSGWHFPQQRIITLEEDVTATMNGTRPPEPLFFRANSGECIEFQLTNLVPAEYELDDYQVRTPTDILGQHIHLVKFDVTSSDGSGNGFNYEDGSFSPEEVQARIKAIRAFNGCGPVGSQFPGTFTCPVAEPHPVFGSGPDHNCNGLPDYLGAQTTVQRWWADPVLLKNGEDQTLRTVFTHDHFGPSTHQQVGLYAGLVVEPENSTWVHNETGVPLSTGRDDGGPTSWQAVIQDGADSYREFLLEFGDFQPAYKEEWAPVCPSDELGYANPKFAINPPGRKSDIPHKIYEKPDPCPISGAKPPCPEAVAADNSGTSVVNYRNEPVAMRIRNPSTNQQAAHGVGLQEPGDLAFAYQTRTDRADSDYNLKPGLPGAGPYPPLTRGLQAGDPYTPVMRAHENDDVKVQVLVGAHEEEHNFTIHGLKWLAEPAWEDSGWRSSQMMGISEHFEFEVGHMPSFDDGKVLDILYKPSAAAEWQWEGLWGLLRIYNGRTVVSSSAQVLEPLPNNPDGRVNTANPDAGFAQRSEEATKPAPFPRGPDGRPENVEDPEVGKLSAAVGKAGVTIPVACPAGAPPEAYDITAVAASEALPNGTLYYNWRNTIVNRLDDPDDPHTPPSSTSNQGPLHDPTAILFVQTTDLVYIGGRPVLKPDAPVEPLVLRANAGDCIEVTLRNDLPTNYADMDGWSGMTMIVENFNANDVDPSLEVSLHPQLVFYDIRQGDGANVGLNTTQYGRQSVAPGEQITYYWYAGKMEDTPTGVVGTPVEFGAIALNSLDPIKHTNKAAVGALIVEPEGAIWNLNDTVNYNDEPQDRKTRAMATVNLYPSGSFREAVLVFQNDVNLRYADGEPVMSLAVNEDSQETGQKAFNYRTEPVWFRHGYKPESAPTRTRQFTDFHRVFKNSYIGGQDPVTPVFTANAGTPTRIRVVHPGGHTQSHVFGLHGHVWEFNPYINGSNNLGLNGDSEWVGTRFGHGPSNHFDALLLHGAGGINGVTGDYMYRDFAPWYLSNGLWGLFRVE